MNYKSLKSYYYNNKDLYKKKRTLRTENEFAVMLPLKIHDNPSFFLPTLEIITKMDSIHHKQTNIIQAYHELPLAAQAQYFKSCLLDEIKYTNDIEGVQSTRHEIQAAYEQVIKADSPQKKLRFSGLVNKYNKLVTHERIKLASSADIRNLYDEIILPEIAKSDYPDGSIFRKNPVDVRSPSDKIIHEGVYGEKNIIKSMDLALSVLKMDALPTIIKTAILHYYLGYIHPFYDGNGRLDRFISSYLLSTSFDPLISYRLSYIIKENRSQYYKAFDECNATYNSGDITPFIITFIDIVEKSTDNILEKVSDGVIQLNECSKCLDRLTLKPLHESILYLLIQNKLFSNTIFSAKDLAEILKKNNSTIKRNISELIELGYPIYMQKEGKKNVYTVDLEKLKNCT